MRKSALVALVLATVLAGLFYAMLARIFPSAASEAPTMLAAIKIGVFTGVWSLVYLILADLQPRDVAAIAEQMSVQTVSKLFRWDRTIRAILLMAIIHLPFLMLALLVLFMRDNTTGALLLAVPGAWVAAFLGGYTLGREEPEAPYRAVEIGQIVLNAGMFAALVFAALLGRERFDAVEGAWIFARRMLTYGFFCGLGAWVGTRTRARLSLQDGAPV